MRHVDHHHRTRLSRRLLDALGRALEWIRDGFQEADDRDGAEYAVQMRALERQRNEKT